MLQPCQSLPAALPGIPRLPRRRDGPRLLHRALLPSLPYPNHRTTATRNVPQERQVASLRAPLGRPRRSRALSPHAVPQGPSPAAPSRPGGGRGLPPLLRSEDGGGAERRRLPQRPEGRPAAGSRRAAAGLRAPLFAGGRVPSGSPSLPSHPSGGASLRQVEGVLVSQALLTFALCAGFGTKVLLKSFMVFSLSLRLVPHSSS